MSARGRAEIEITASSSRLGAGLAQARAKFQEFAAATARGIGGAFKKINKVLEPGETLKNAGGHFLGNMATRGTDAIVDAAQNVRDFERSLVRYQITTKGSAADTAAMRREVRALSRETALSADEVLAGATQYVALTGDTKGASAAMAAFARIAQASGSSITDIATATAALQTSMGLTSGDVEAVFSGMIVQGKEGAVELKDMAAQLASLAPQFANFRGAKSVGGIREMGAAFQVIRTGAGDASEAATQFESLMGELAKPEVVRKLAKLKVNLYDKNGKRSASEIFEDLAKVKELGDDRVVASLFARKEAQQAIRSIRNHIDLYRQLRDQAQDTGAVQRDLNTFLESDAGRLDKAMNGLKVSIAEAFTPERIKGFVSAIEALAQKIGPVVTAVGKIGDVLGGLEGVGESVRGAFDHVEGSEYSTRDMYLANTEGGFDIGGDNSDEARAARAAGAKSRMADVDAFNKAKDSIMGAEVGGKSSEASIRKAFEEKYNKIDVGKGHLGAEDAGRRYLRAAGVQDPVEVAMKTMEAITAAGQQAKVVAPIVAAIKEGFAGSKTDVAIDGNKVAVATKKATNARRGG